MIKKIGAGILKYRKVILFVIALLLAVTVVGTIFLSISDSKINSDMVSYLGDDSETKKGLEFLQSEFGIRGNVTVVVRVDENDANNVAALDTAIANVEKIDKVTGVTWYGTVSSYEQLDEGMQKILSELNENRDYLAQVADNLKNQDVYENADDLIALLQLADYYGVDFIDTSSMETYLRHPTETAGVYDYVLLVLTDVDAGGGEYTLLDDIKAQFTYTSYAVSGTSETAQRLLSDTMGDLPWFLLAGIGCVLVILLLTTSSFLEPLILLFTLLVGVVVSMGMNYLFPTISIISFAICSVLQLAITMDYAVFYMHVYRRNRATLDIEKATVESFPEVASSVLASGLTTIGGFAALYFMEFRIGADIANVLIKSVVTSMLAVMILQPILTFMLDEQIAKTRHNFTAKFNAAISAKRVAKGKKPVTLTRTAFSRPIAKFAVWQRVLLVVIALGLLVPSYLAQSKVRYSYLQLYEKSNVTDEEKLADELGNQLILAVPLRIIKSGATQQDFIAAVKNVNKDRITGMLGAFTAVDISEDVMEALLNVATNENTTDLKDLKTYLTDDSYKSMLEEYDITDPETLAEICDTFIEFTDNVDTDTLKSYFRKVDGEWYTLYTISFSGNTEDAEAQEAYRDITDICASYFGQNNYYPVGVITSAYEMSTITPHDFLVVTLVSIAVIYLIVAFLLRNPLKSFFVVLIIELGIWINLAFNYVFGQSVNFIAYIIISSVQLGCTVDYAILFANTFENNRKIYSTGKECSVATATETIPPILTSAAMISSVCFSMYLISNNIIIKQLTGMLARGAAISFVLVTVLQTAVWSFFKTPRKTHNYEEKLKELNDGKAVSPKKKKLSAAEKLALLEDGGSDGENGKK
jgi:predicted RND superfamily exporter protein